MAYAPDAGDIIWLDFSPQSGNEQAGHRPALVVTPKLYNEKVGLAIVCPVTSKAKNYPFEITIPSGLPIAGVILCDQLKSVDWQARNSQFVCTVPKIILQEAREMARVLLEL